MDARSQLSSVLADVAGDPVFVAGSLVAAVEYDNPAPVNDVDLFCPTFQVLVATAQKLLIRGYTLDARFSRVWYRWLRYGIKSWHTNSLKMSSPQGVEVNLVYKMHEGHATTSLSQVLESFDFGLLGMGYEAEDGAFRDLRSYLFPGIGEARIRAGCALPMMPNKSDNWTRGFISRYNGLRESGRYAKYFLRGYDMSLVRDQLVTGYREAALYLTQSFEEDQQKLGQIYYAIGDLIENDRALELQEAANKIDYNDELDEIMKALE